MVYPVVHMLYMGRGIPINRLNKVKDRGLSFIEIVIVMVIMSLISLAVYANLNSGIKIWQRINKPRPEEDLNIFLDRFAQDLKNALNFQGLDFLGAEDSFELASAINSPALKTKTVGKVIYYYDRRDKILKRQQQDLSQIYNRQDSSLTRQLENVDALRFQYCSYDKEKKEFIWQEEWKTKDELPLSVRIELEFNNGTQTKAFSRTVDIPISG